VFLATQSLAQVREVYGAEMQQVILQTTKTKLILNSPDPDSAKILSDTIGQQIRMEPPNNRGYHLRTWRGLNEDFAWLPVEMAQTLMKWSQAWEDFFPPAVPPRDQWKWVEGPAVPPALIQHLQPCQGYLLVSDGSPVARVEVPLCSYETVVEHFLPR
jgi:hypothetical protein